jgi:hypothetical protein
MLRRAALRFLSVAIAIGVLCASPDARALGPINVEVGSKIGGATSPTGSPNPLAFEWGERAGISFLNFYGGLALVSSAGSQASVLCVGPVFTACTTTTTSVVAISAHSIRYGFEGGYDIKVLHRIAFRPQVSVGSLSFYESSPAQIIVRGRLMSLDGTAHDLYLEPGVTTTVSLGHLFLGADVNILWLPTKSDSNAAFAAHGQVGVKF